MGARWSLPYALQSMVLGFMPYRVMRRTMLNAPFPTGAATGQLPGPAPVLVAVIGEATAVGYQTLSAELTVGAQLARRLSSRNRRGVRWEAMHTQDFTIRTARTLLRENPQLIVVDVMVVLLGIGDAIRFTTPRAWRANMSGLLADLRKHLVSTSTILVAEVPPLELSPETPSLLAARIGRHVELLNTITRELVADIDNATSIPFPSGLVHSFETPDGDDTFYGRVYRSWASVMADQVSIPRL